MSDSRDFWFVPSPCPDCGWEHGTNAPECDECRNEAEAQRDYAEHKERRAVVTQAIAVGYCEWVNGESPDDADLEEARPAAQHIAGYVMRALREAR
jgi:hypothetical protein